MAKLLIACTSVLVLALMYAYRSPSLPHVNPPAEFAKFTCQQNSRFVAAEGYEVAKVGDTMLVIPCRPAGSIGDIGKHWETKPESQRYMQLSFEKRADGTFIVSDEANNPLLSSARTRYAVRVTYRPVSADVPGYAGTKGTRRVVELDTPTSFARGGSTATFECLDALGGRRSCITEVQSNALFWRVLVSFGHPISRETDEALSKDLFEALVMLGAHIAEQ